MKSIRIFSLLLASLVAIVAAAPANAQSGAANRQIIPIKGDLYRFQNNFHFSVFLVTPPGVIATDPIDAEAARWLENEIRKRFGKEIRYVIYSHDHRDHSAGGEVWADTAIVVAHERAKEVIVAEKRPTAVPNVTFRERMTIELGGKRVELLYPGKSHSDNLIVVLFPEERAAFTVDFINVKRLPYQDFPDSYWPDFIDAIKFVENLDFDILIPGHGATGTREDARDHRVYIEKLYNAVLAGARAGKSVEQLKQELTFEEYRGWGQYEAWRPLNIEGLYQRVQLQRRDN